MTYNGITRRHTRRCLLSVSPLALSVGLLAFAAAPAAADSCSLSSAVSWSLGGAGNWSVGGNWTGGSSPNGSGTNVCVTDGSSAVTVDNNPAVASLQIASGNSVSVNTNASLAIYGPSWSNAGAFAINGGSGYNTFVYVGSGVTLSGGGTVTLNTASGGGNPYILQASGGSTLVNQDNTIQGAGFIGSDGLAFSNNGVVNANASGQALDLNRGNGGLTNSGTLKATNGGSLNLWHGVNNAGGAITAGNGGTVTLAQATVTGGTLNTVGNGVLQTYSTAALNGVTLSSGSTYTTGTNTATYLGGAFTNNGVVQVNGGGGYNTFLYAASTTTTLTGGGTVTLSAAAGGGNAYLEQASGGLTLVNKDNLIQGAGFIGSSGLAFVNNATVNANVSGQVLDINRGNGGLTNTKTLEATNGGSLNLWYGVTNTGANITVGAGSSVQLVQATVTGGTLNNASGGTLQTSGYASLGGVTLSSGSTYTTGTNTATYLANTFTNNGVVQVNGGGGYNTFLYAASTTTTLTGGGTVTLSAAAGGGNAYLEQASGGLTLVNKDNLIQGAGFIGSSGLAFVNNATVNANVSGQALDINRGNGGLTNTKTIEATGGGSLNLWYGVTNSGANITAGNGSTVTLAQATVTGGTLNSVGSGSIQTYGYASLDGVTLSSGSTYTTGTNTDTYLANTFTNKGLVQVNGGGGYNTFLYAGSTTTTLTGGGTVTLSAAAGGGNAYLEQASGGLTLVNKDNLIQGAGFIGSSGLAFVNNATVNANVSGQVLDMNRGNGGLTNTKTIEATGGGSLNLWYGVNNAGANITAGDGSSVTLAQATVTGGTLNTVGSGSMQTYGYASLDGVTLSSGSTYTTGTNTDTYLVNTFTNKGVVQVNGGGGYNTFLLASSTTTTLTGGGTVTLSAAAGGGNAFIGQASGGVTLVNQDNLIQGSGYIGADGLAFVNGPGGTLFANVGGATLNVGQGGGSFVNTGTVKVLAGANLVVTGDANGFQQKQGTSGSPVTLVDGVLYAQRGFNLQAGVLKGTGTVVANVNNSGGAVAPGDSPGILTIQGNYTQGAGGAFEELLAGTTAGTGYSQLVVTGSAALDGLLDITKSAGFTLALGDTFTILDFASSTGNFVNFDYNGSACSFTGGLLGCAGGVQFAEQFSSGYLNLVVENVGVPGSVPEPSTWAMMLIGFAGLGFAGYRRGKSERIAPLA